VGTPIHNLEITPGKGGQLVRSAGSAAAVLTKEKNYVDVRLPSGEVRRIDSRCCATIGQMGGQEAVRKTFGKAGSKRRIGIKPTVRGVAQNPHSHPHGGGEGRSGIGMPAPKTPWGKNTKGKKTRRRQKYSDRWIIQRRRKNE
jgi:large subunit ribosomal protein L2